MADSPAPRTPAPGKTNPRWFIPSIAGAFGALVGTLVSPIVVRLLPSEPPWLTPALVVGSIAVCLLLALAVAPTIARQR